jgi:hypothetical protein
MSNTVKRFINNYAHGDYHYSIFVTPDICIALKIKSTDKEGGSVMNGSISDCLWTHNKVFKLNDAQIDFE